VFNMKNRVGRSHSRSGSQFERQAAYSRAVRVGPYIAVSGTAALTPAGEVIAPGDVYRQATEAIRRALTGVEELGGSPENVIRTRLYLAPGAIWQDAIRAHAEAFTNIDPANTTLFVHGFVPDGVLVEVELDAIV
jgi:enamine deaminase RidA (YjgF/YER057c/UK114 family)